jgi:predicted nucleic acid-binding protein
MARTNRRFIPGHIRHPTHRCHKCFDGNDEKNALKKEEVESAWEIIQQIPVDLRQTDIKSALSIAIKFNLYAYDAYFLRCAENLRSPLLTLDFGRQRVAREMGITILE